MGATPFLGGGFGHFYAYAPTKIEYAIDRYAMEVKRQMDVLDRRLAETEYLARRRIHDRRNGGLALVRRLGARACCMARASFSTSPATRTFNVGRPQIGERPAVKRGVRVNRAWGDHPMAEAPRRRDFDRPPVEKAAE